MTKQVLKFGAAVMVTIFAIIVFWQFRIVVIYVLISLMLAASMRPITTFLASRGIFLRVVYSLLFLMVLAGFGALIFFSSEQAVNEIQQLAQTLSSRDQWRMPLWLDGSSFQQALMKWLPPPSKLFEAMTGTEGQLVLPALYGFTKNIGMVISGGLVILLLSVYWSISQNHFERLWLSLLPSGQRMQGRRVWRTVEPDMGAYIRGQVLQSILAGVLFGLGYWILGSLYPALLALCGALACLIPVVGPVIAVLLPLLVGLLTSLQVSIFTGLYSLLILIILLVWIKPRLLNNRWDNPILTVVMIIALADAFGIIGIIIAPPLSVVCQILWSRLVSHRLIAGAAEQFSDLKERQESLLEFIKMMEEPPPPVVTSSMERLSSLMGSSEPILQAAMLEGTPGTSMDDLQQSSQENSDA